MNFEAQFHCLVQQTFSILERDGQPTPNTVNRASEKDCIRFFLCYVRHHPEDGSKIFFLISSRKLTLTNDALWPWRLVRGEVILAAVNADVICLYLCCRDGISFSSEPAHRPILFSLSFHAFLCSLQMITKNEGIKKNKKLISAMKAAAVIFLG